MLQDDGPTHRMLSSNSFSCLDFLPGMVGLGLPNKHILRSGCSKRRTQKRTGPRLSSCREQDYLPSLSRCRWFDPVVSVSAMSFLASLRDPGGFCGSWATRRRRSRCVRGDHTSGGAPSLLLGWAAVSLPFQVYSTWSPELCLRVSSHFACSFL
ncbi:hypothetical protein BDW22DRAFT_318473 [Trametopsis cervina]|nr:hypothetical protein BDW22DRAFT_318473 [Trametopsis cervina]